jgi:hypothetical protein
MDVRLPALRAGRPLLQEDSWYWFLLEAESIPGPAHRATERIRSIEKSNDLIGIRTRDLPACSIVPQPTTLPRAPTESGRLRLNSIPTLKFKMNFIKQHRVASPPQVLQPELCFSVSTNPFHSSPLKDLSKIRRHIIGPVPWLLLIHNYVKEYKVVPVLN